MTLLEEYEAWVSHVYNGAVTAANPDTARQHEELMNAFMSGILAVCTCELTDEEVTTQLQAFQEVLALRVILGASSATGDKGVN